MRFVQVVRGGGLRRGAAPVLVALLLSSCTFDDSGWIRTRVVDPARKRRALCGGSERETKRREQNCKRDVQAFGVRIARLGNALLVAEQVDAISVPVRERVLHALVGSRRPEH
jgi:hypothetical protein